MNQRLIKEIHILGHISNPKMQPEFDVLKKLEQHKRKDGSVFYTLRDGRHASWIWEIKRRKA